jgi:two-component system, chemotaxis family, response regulator Rcp1
MKLQDYILCVDDDEDDCKLLEEALKKGDKNIKLEFVLSGEEAIEFLTSAIQNNHLPRLIILDLNMPKLNGTEVLLQIRRKLKLDIPVLFFTTSSRTHDVLFGEENGASLLVKPTSFQGYEEVVDTIFKSLI